MIFSQGMRGVFLILIGLLVAAPVYAEKFEDLAQSLISLRGEVEELQSQLDMEKQEHKGKVDSLSSQMSDLSVEHHRQKLALEKMDLAVKKLQEAKEAKLSGEEVLLPYVLASLENLRQIVTNGLPFKISERIAELDSLRNQLESGNLDPKRAANRIWAFIEDELRLTRENGVYSQSIALNDKYILAEVAKLGSMFLYFKTSDNQFGMAQKKNGSWQFVELNDSSAKRRINSLFDSLKKQIRQGYFELPNPLES